MPQVSKLICVWQYMLFLLYNLYRCRQFGMCQTVYVVHVIYYVQMSWVWYVSDSTWCLCYKLCTDVVSLVCARHMWQMSWDWHMSDTICCACYILFTDALSFVCVRHYIYVACVILRTNVFSFCVRRIYDNYATFPTIVLIWYETSICWFLLCCLQMRWKLETNRLLIQTHTNTDRRISIYTWGGLNR